MNESQSQAPRFHWRPAPSSRAGERGRRVDGRLPEPRREAKTASGPGELGSKPKRSRRSSAPTPAPRLSRSAPPPRAASHSPGPAAASSHFHQRPPPPASGSRRAEQRQPRRPEARRCLRLHRPAGRAEGAAFPVSAAGVRRARRQWAAGGGKGAERTGGRGRYLPLLAGEGGRRWPPRSRGWGLVRGRVPGARRALRAVGSGQREQAAAARRRRGWWCGAERPSWGAGPAAGPQSVRPCFPPSPRGRRLAGRALCSSAGSWPRSRPPQPPPRPTPGARAVSPSSPQEDL
ncbi:PREDICTED: atherin [Cercocebus atys]|uniref:atherin n=1 Tax=Cercocebus atys TaxID=9531 RepID=UPI0005F3DE8D|nr:PREDICTED: atherin [Cercocebus atys]